jgi:membrane fusion protein (multidrug efflux system)
VAHDGEVRGDEGRFMTVRRWIGSFVLVAAVLAGGAALAFWKITTIQAAIAAGSNQPEPSETVAVANAVKREHRRSTTSIGTVVALRSISLRNETAGTVRKVNLVPGEIVDAGKVLVQLDIAVEEAELKAVESQAALAETILQRAQRLRQSQSAAQEELDRARAERDVALAQIARIKAVIDRKTIRAPFRSRVGLANVHPGQYLGEGDNLTTLQGVDEDVHVDFAVNQQVAAGLKVDDPVEVVSTVTATPLLANVVAVDSRVDVTTRNAQVRVRVAKAPSGLAPGASVRVRIPVGEARQVVAVPATAIRKGATGDHVFIIEPDKEGKRRARQRQVESGAMIGDEILVYSGLKPGETVAASGSFKLREGVLVNPAEDTPAKESAADSKAAQR